MTKKASRTLAEIRLHQAAMDGDAEAAQKAVAEGASVNSREEEHAISPLLWACSSGHLEVAAYLIDAGAEINSADENDSTPLHNAVFRGHIELVQYLLKRGADTDALDGSGLTALEAAVAYEEASVASRKAIIDAILETGYDINSSNQQLNHQTPLMVAAEAAAETGDTEVMLHLLSRGADATVADSEGNQVADYAGLGDYADEVQMLLRT